jgi:4-hydroxy-4-methyl-2-oxoglutarate aldolase
MDIADRIIDRIKRNRISTTEISDCLNKSGVLAGVLPINSRHFVVGRVFWAYGWAESNWTIHERIKDVRDGDVVVITAIECGERALIGSLVSKFLMLYRQAAGVVVQGGVRDVPHIIRENWPVWSETRTPIGCFNRCPDDQPSAEVLNRYRAQYEGAIAVCDDSGVVVIPAAAQTEAFLDTLDWIEEQEDIWFDCIDRLKWDTFDTVCRKRYEQGRG